MPVGRSSSEEARRAQIKASIKPGCILHIFCDFIENPKPKFIVIMHTDPENDEFLVFTINSEIPPFIEDDPHLRAGQIMLRATTYTFLTHDSYIDCIKVHYGFNSETPHDHRGKLHKTEIRKIIAFVQTAQTIPPDDKSVIIKSLGGHNGD